MSVKENSKCKNCNDTFGKVVKDGLCSNCYAEAESLKKVNEPLEDYVDWPEGQDEREE